MGEAGEDGAFAAEAGFALGAARLSVRVEEALGVGTRRVLQQPLEVGGEVRLFAAPRGEPPCYSSKTRPICPIFF